MQVKSTNDGLLTNYEVLDLIKERKAQRDYWRKNTIDLQPRIAMENKIQQYMKRSANKDLSFEQVKTLLAQLKALKLRLSEEELIQLVNLMPTSEVEMYLIVNNAADRLTEEQSTALLDTIRAFVPSEEDANGGNGSAEPLDPDLAAEALAQYSTDATEKK